MNLYDHIVRSFQSGKIHNWFFHDGITFATWGLVFATLLLVVYGFIGGRKQQHRWDEEDKQRKNDRDELHSRWERDDANRREENRPKYSFGISVDEHGCHLWISNLGVTPFLVRTVFLNRRVFGTRDFVFAPGAWNEVITPGSKRIFKFEKSLFWNDELRKANGPTIVLECEAGCSIIGVEQDATNSVMKEFTIYANSQTGFLWLAKNTEF